MSKRANPKFQSVYCCDLVSLVFQQFFSIEVLVDFFKEGKAKTSERILLLPCRALIPVNGWVSGEEETRASERILLPPALPALSVDG